MQPHTNVIPFPARTDGYGAAHYIAWRWSRGALTIMVEGFDADNVDGETLFSFSPEVGVEIGEPTVLALSGEPSMLLFKGSFIEQRDFFSGSGRTWRKKTSGRPSLSMRVFRAWLVCSSYRPHHFPRSMKQRRRRATRSCGWLVSE